MKLPPIAPHVLDEHVRTYFPQDAQAIITDPLWEQSRHRITAAYGNDLIDIADALRMARNSTTPGDAVASDRPAHWLTRRVVNGN